MVIASVTSPTYGHLVLTVTPAVYVTYGVKSFQAPVNPGLNPSYADDTSTDPIRESNCRHTICRVYHDTYHAADKALLNFFLDVIPEIYLEFIKYDTLGFVKCISLDILCHLCYT